MAKQTDAAAAATETQATDVAATELEQLKAQLAKMEADKKAADDKLAETQLQLELKSDEIDELTRIVQEVKTATPEQRLDDLLPGQKLYEVSAVGKAGANLRPVVVSGYDTAEAAAKFFQSYRITDTHKYTVTAVPITTKPVPSAA